MHSNSFAHRRGCEELLPDQPLALSTKPIWGTVGGPVKRIKSSFSTIREHVKTLPPESQVLLCLRRDRTGNLSDETLKRGIVWCGKTLVSNPGQTVATSSAIGWATTYTKANRTTPGMYKFDYDRITLEYGVRLSQCSHSAECMGSGAAATLKYFPAGSTYVDSLP